MRIRDLFEELECFNDDTEIQVEVNGVVHDIHDISDDSQGVYLVVDLDTEEREMR